MRNTNKKNTSLYFYRLKAKIIQFCGISLLSLSVGVGLVLGLAMGSLLFDFIGLAGFVGGIILFLRGKSLRFDYQRQSGAIIHQGDWS
jgi:hypothetical protein